MSQQQQSNIRSYLILAILGCAVLTSYLFLLRGVLTLSQPTPQALATTTISAMYKRQVNLSSRCDAAVNTNGRVEPCLLSRLIDYCTVDDPSGAEGSRSSIPLGEWRMEHLVLNIRHGDRTALHKIDQSFTPLPLEGSGDLQSSKILKMLRVASKFRVSSLENKDLYVNNISPLTSEGYSVHDYNPVDSFLEVSDRNLLSGQLTTVGFLQHILLGEHLNGAYMPLLQRIQEPNSNPLIAVRSTSYNRTIQSVAGLLSSLLPPSVHYSDVNIHYQPHPSLENMHGFISNKFHTPGRPVQGGVISKRHVDGEVVLNNPAAAASCPMGVASLKRMLRSYENTTIETHQRLSNIFSPTIMEPYSTLAHISDVADPLLTAFCHQERYPCGIESNKCGSDSLLRAVMIDSDRSFCERYTSAYGGLQYTKLDIYPFVEEIKNVIVEAARQHYRQLWENGANSNNKGAHMDRILRDEEQKKKPILHVFSGHDTVISPVLTALGIYQHASYCNWPNYASRISFESWVPVGKIAENFSLKRNMSAFSFHNSLVHIRVVYNGEDVTGNIPACEAHNVRYTKRDGMKSLLCPLEHFVKQIESNLGSYQSLKDACRL